MVDYQIVLVPFSLLALASLDPHVIPSSETPANAPIRLAGDICRIAGDWTVQSLASADQVAERRAQLARASSRTKWDLSHIARLDGVGALLLWHAWGQRWPAFIRISPGNRSVIDYLASLAGDPLAPPSAPDPLRGVRAVGGALLKAAWHALTLVRLLGQLALDVFGWLRAPAHGPWREVSAQVYRSGAQALGITALVGFLIGVVLSYLSASQLQTVGADQFIVRLLGVAITRELGPLLAAILVAGRSGSAMPAQLGVMRVTQELDALQVMGISVSQRLILPRVIALAMVMPLLVLWTGALALMGGMLAAYTQLGIPIGAFINALPEAISLANYGIGLIKGVAFGVTIALIGCHFGLLIEPNTDSLGRGTTTAVVTAITAVILVNAVFAISLRGVGL